MLTTFEHFRNMFEDEYAAAVRLLLVNPSTLRKFLAQDIHEVGVHLASCFQRLRRSYGTFAIALCIVMVNFVTIQWRLFT